MGDRRQRRLVCVVFSQSVFFVSASGCLQSKTLSSPTHIAFKCKICDVTAFITLQYTSTSPPNSNSFGNHFSKSLQLSYILMEVK